MRTIKSGVAAKAAKSALQKRTNSFTINPEVIVVDFTDKSGNPRLDYGDDFDDFKQTIKDYGVQSAIKLYKDEDGKYHLAHGFRRMKAVLDLLAEGHVTESVPFDEVEKNDEQILIEHFTLNSGKPLNDVEMAEGLKRLGELSGEKNVAALAKRVGMDYQKAHNLMTFIKKAGTQVKTAVIKNEISFNGGFIIAKKAKNVTEQNELLKEGKQAIKQEGTAKIRVKHISKLNTEVKSFDLKLKLALAEAAKGENANQKLIELFSQVIDAVKENKSITSLLSQGKKKVKPEAEHTTALHEAESQTEQHSA